MSREEGKARRDAWDTVRLFEGVTVGVRVCWSCLVPVVVLDPNAAASYKNSTARERKRLLVRRE